MCMPVCCRAPSPTPPPYRLRRGLFNDHGHLPGQAFSIIARRHERHPSYAHTAAPVLGPQAATPGVAANSGPSVDVSSSVRTVQRRRVESLVPPSGCASRRLCRVVRDWKNMVLATAPADSAETFTVRQRAARSCLSYHEGGGRSVARPSTRARCSLAKGKKKHIKAKVATSRHTHRARRVSGTEGCCIQLKQRSRQRHIALYSIYSYTHIAIHNTTSTTPLAGPPVGARGRCRGGGATIAELKKSGLARETLRTHRLLLVRCLA